jgi:signal transduction histidine kinase
MRAARPVPLRRKLTWLVAPVQALAAAAGVKTKADYSVRVERTDDDELGQLTDAFIGMARISRTEPVIQTVKLTRMAKEIVGFLRSAATAPRAVAVEITPDLECQGVERLLRIVLESLLGNAWKFTARVTFENPKYKRARFRFAPGFAPSS